MRLKIEVILKIDRLPFDASMTKNNKNTIRLSDSGLPGKE